MQNDQATQYAEHGILSYKSKILRNYCRQEHEFHKQQKYLGLNAPIYLITSPHYEFTYKPDDVI